MSNSAQLVGPASVRTSAQPSKPQSLAGSVRRAPKKAGRKPGKRSDANYTQTSLYLPIELRNKVRAKLYEQGKELSGLVEGMLRDWLLKQA